jgi:hypothetical protein
LGHLAAGKELLKLIVVCYGYGFAAIFHSLRGLHKKEGKRGREGGREREREGERERERERGREREREGEREREDPLDSRLWIFSST